MSPQCPLKNNGGGQTNNGDSGNQGNRGDQKKSPFKIPPNQGEPHEKMIDGKRCLWCGKCGRWTSGDKIHNTDQHIVGKNKNKPDAGVTWSPDTTGGDNSGVAGLASTVTNTDSDNGHHELVGTFGFLGSFLPLKEGAGRHE